MRFLFVQWTCDFNPIKTIAAINPIETIAARNPIETIAARNGFYQNSHSCSKRLQDLTYFHSNKKVNLKVTSELKFVTVYI